MHLINTVNVTPVTHEDLGNLPYRHPPRIGEWVALHGAYFLVVMVAHRPANLHPAEAGYTVFVKRPSGETLDHRYL